MHTDRYMADRGQYRRRRYSVLWAVGDSGEFGLCPHEPHYQSREHNRIHGGIRRHFAPFEPATVESVVFREMVRFSLNVVGRVAGCCAWRIQAHQFRVVARPHVAGRPTPEGIHRDGADFVLMALIARRNVTGGTTTLCRTNGRHLADLTLVKPTEGLLLDDRALMHGVSPIAPADASRPAYRDMLVLTFHAR